MQTLERNEKTTPALPAMPRRRRRILLFGTATLAFVLAAGTVAALASLGSTASRREHRPGSAQTAPVVVPTPTGVLGSGGGSTPSPAAHQASDPTALADGTYPAYVRDVDVRGAKVTIDVIQTFTGTAAVEAAIEDGSSRRDARQYLYEPVYVRNENPLLRTLPVAADVRIEFMGSCESPGNRHAALRELSKKTSPFDTTYYYGITVEAGVVHRMVQHLAISAC